MLTVNALKRQSGCPENIKISSSKQNCVLRGTPSNEASWILLNEIMNTDTHTHSLQFFSRLQSGSLKINIWVMKTQFWELPSCVLALCGHHEQGWHVWQKYILLRHEQNFFCTSLEFLLHKHRESNRAKPAKGSMCNFVRFQANMRLRFIIIIINSITARVVGAPQMTLQPVFSSFAWSLKQVSKQALIGRRRHSHH